MEKFNINDFDAPLEKDEQLYNLILSESKRQEEHLELIASENYVSKAIMEAQGSILTNKYAEGYPNKRYYGGCKFIDGIEILAIERLKELFGVKYANVQPHSGSQANQAVYNALLNPGDTILGMDLSSGGHLTHGSKVSSSGKIYNAITYGVNHLGLIDYVKLQALATEHKPKLIIAGASSYSRVIDWKKISEIAKSVDAYFMADIAHYSGLIATNLYDSPVNFADVITSTTHKTLRGPRGGIIMTNNEDLSTKINSAIFPGIQGGPLEHVIAGKAICFAEALQPQFKDYCIQVKENALIMVNRFKEYGYDIVSGGTDCHMFLLDLRTIGVKGNIAQNVLEAGGITVNKNSIPNDPEKATITSGIRIGTAALTTRGFRRSEMREIVDIINNLLTKEINIEQSLNKVKELTSNYPVYR